MTDVLSLLTTCWGVVMGLAPKVQLRIIIRTDASGTSPTCLAILLTGLLLWLTYGAVTGSAPLVITNAVSCTVLVLLLATLAPIGGRHPGRTSSVPPTEGGSNGRTCHRA